MDKLALVKSAYYQLLVDGFHPVVGGSAALYARKLCKDFNDIDIIIPEKEWIHVELPFKKEVTEVDNWESIRYKKYNFAGIEVCLLKNILGHESNYDEIDGIKYATIEDIRESREYIKKTYKGNIERLIIKWANQINL